MEYISDVLNIALSNLQTERSNERRASRRDERIQSQQQQRQRTLSSVLVVGRSGSGKTYYINAAWSGSTRNQPKSFPATRYAVSYRTTLHHTKFRLIDTPGFDNMDLSDAQAFTEIVDYFLHPERIDRRINGIIYIHPAGDSLRSRALLRALNVLSDLFLDTIDCARLTIFVPRNGLQVDPSKIEADMRHSSSMFSKICSMGAKIVTSKDDLDDFIGAIIPYASMNSILLPFQRPDMRHSRSVFLTRLESILGGHGKEPVQSRLTDLKRQQESSEIQLQELRSALKDRDAKIDKFRKDYDQIENLCAIQHEAETALRQELYQTQEEYASLRSQLQLQENIEQSDIVQSLKDLNRSIDDLGRSISAYLVDKYIQATFGKDPAEVTALDARNLPELKSFLGHVDGTPSLVASSTGEGMDVESFFDFSIRTLLCSLLIKHIFQPFHPLVDESQNEALHAAYKDIQAREPQAVAGKWRSNTFKSIYKPERPNAITNHIDSLTRGFFRDYLGPPIGNFFGEPTTLERQHFINLRQLIQAAWDWNSKLKEEVIMLGDFEQFAFDVLSKFNPKWMEEFEPKSRAPRAKSILGTLGLGLISVRAVGGGHPTEDTVVCKAMVATNNLYA